MATWCAHECFLSPAICVLRYWHFYTVTLGDLSGRWLRYYTHVLLLSRPSKIPPQRCFHEPLSVFPTSLLLHVIVHSVVFPSGRYAVRSFYFFHCPDLVICSCHVLCWQLHVILVRFQPLLSNLKDCSCQLIKPRNSKVALYYLTGKWWAQSSYNDENRKLKG